MCVCVFIIYFGALKDYQNYMLKIITFRVSRKRREMSFGRARLCVCVSVCLFVRGRMPTLLHEPGCNLGEWQGMPPSCALLGEFAIGARLRCSGNITRT